MNTQARSARSKSGQVAHVTCLGCGCACDDILLTIKDEAIVQAEHACPLGIAWFGDGRVPGRVCLDGQDCGVDEAVNAAADLLRQARGRLYVFLGDALTCAAHQAVLGIADLLRGTVDGVVSEGAAQGILAAQRRGRASATLGEIRNRADLVLYWGVDPDERYPRFRSRYAGYPSGLHLRRGHRSRTVISVSVGADAGPAEADLHLRLQPAQELSALAELRARLLGRSLGDAAQPAAELAEVAGQLARAKYVAIVHDGEDGREHRSPDRAEALIALAQTLNTPTRAALTTLRGGGNRTGAETVTTWQTGYPFAVDFSRGFPSYQPDRLITDLFGHRSFVAGLITGTAASVPESIRTRIAGIPVIVVGPRASEAPFPAKVVIDTGVAGIHEAGLGYRMDDIPLPLQAAVPGPRPATEILAQLAGRLWESGR